MGLLYSRLLIILNEEQQDSTFYHIATVMLQMMDVLGTLSINELAQACGVSMSTISRFVRYIGYEDYSDYLGAIPRGDNSDDYAFSYVPNVMGYIDEVGLDGFVDTVLADMRATYEQLDWEAIDRLVVDLYTHEHVGIFGLMYSETAAIDFQSKLSHFNKFVVTNLSDIKQEEYIRQADENTLIVIFSDSGMFMDSYQDVFILSSKEFPQRVRAKFVVITANPEAANDPRVSYCVLFQRTQKVSTHREVYSMLTDIIAYRYRDYARRMGHTAIGEPETSPSE